MCKDEQRQYPSERREALAQTLQEARQQAFAIARALHLDTVEGIALSDLLHQCLCRVNRLTNRDKEVNRLVAELAKLYGR